MKAEEADKRLMGEVLKDFLPREDRGMITDIELATEPFDSIQTRLAMGEIFEHDYVGKLGRAAWLFAPYLDAWRESVLGGFDDGAPIDKITGSVLVQMDLSDDLHFGRSGPASYISRT